MTATIQAMKREDLTKSTTKQLRNNGQVPSIVYGNDTQPKTIAVDSMELLKTVRDEGKNAIISLDIQGDTQVDVMLHEYQADDIKGQLLHADFYVVNMMEEMDTTVPIRIVGKPENGVVQQPLFEVQVRARPNQFPNEIIVDVSKHSIGDIIAVNELQNTGSYKILDDADTVVASVLAPNTNADMEGLQETGEEPPLTGEAQTDKNED